MDYGSGVDWMRMRISTWYILEISLGGGLARLVIREDCTVTVLKFRRCRAGLLITITRSVNHRALDAATV